MWVTIALVMLIGWIKRIEGRLARLIKWIVLFKLVVRIVLGVFVATTAIVIMTRRRDQLGLAVAIRFCCRVSGAAGGLGLRRIEIVMTTNVVVVLILVMIMVVWSKKKKVREVLLRLLRLYRFLPRHGVLERRPRGDHHVFGGCLGISHILLLVA